MPETRWLSLLMTNTSGFMTSCFAVALSVSSERIVFCIRGFISAAEREVLKEHFIWNSAKCELLCHWFSPEILLSESFLHNAPGLKSQCSTTVCLMHCRWPVINLHLRPSSPTSLVYPERPSGPQKTCRPHPLWPSVSSAERAAHPQSGRNSVSQESEKSQKIFIIYPLKFHHLCKID